MLRYYRALLLYPGWSCPQSIEHSYPQSLKHSCHKYINHYRPTGPREHSNPFMVSSLKLVSNENYYPSTCAIR
jgi:hypothetical protein